MRTLIVGRFRRRVDAEGHLRVLKQMIPGVIYEIMFDITPEPTDSDDLTPPTLIGRKEKGELISPHLAGEGLGEKSIKE